MARQVLDFRFGDRGVIWCLAMVVCGRGVVDMWWVGGADLGGAGCGLVSLPADRFCRGWCVPTFFDLVCN
jgi:hypothetical protein